MKRLLIVLLLLAVNIFADCELKQGFPENEFYVQITAIEKYDQTTECGMTGKIRGTNAYPMFYPDNPEIWSHWKRRSFDFLEDVAVLVCNPNCIQAYDDWQNHLQIDSLVKVYILRYKEPNVRAIYKIEIYP